MSEAMCFKCGHEAERHGPESGCIECACPLCRIPAATPADAGLRARVTALRDGRARRAAEWGADPALWSLVETLDAVLAGTATEETTPARVDIDHEDWQDENGVWGKPLHGYSCDGIECRGVSS